VIYIFDFNGTLRGNEVAPEVDTLRLLKELKAAQHELIIWTGAAEVPEKFRRVVDEVWFKDFSFSPLDQLKGRVCLCDDDPLFLRTVQRYVARNVPAVQIYTTHASRILSLWQGVVS